MARARGHTGADAPRSSTAAWWEAFAGFWLRDPTRRLTLAGLACALALASFGTQHFRVGKELASGHRVLGASAETVWLPPPTVLRAVSLGSQGFVADLLFLRVAHYFVDHLLTDSQLPHIDLYLDAIWALDAHNRTTYRWGAQVIKFGQRIDREVNDRANRFARLGIEHFPDDAWLYHEIAYNLYLYRHRLPPAEKAAVETLALAYLDIAYKLPGFTLNPNYLAHLYERAGHIDDAVLTSMVAYGVGNAEERRALRLRLLERDRAQVAGQLAWLDRMQRRDWRWLPPALAMLVGPKRLAVPPQDAARPEHWLAEVATDASLARELQLDYVEPVAAVMAPGVAQDAAEWHLPQGSPFSAPPPLPAPITETAAMAALLPPATARGAGTSPVPAAAEEVP